MPEQETLRRVERDKAAGKAATTQAGEFIREEFEHIRAGKHGARSAKQAIAIGLSKARRAGVKLPPPRKGTVAERTRQSAERTYRKGQTDSKQKPSPRRSKAILGALQREGHEAASHTAIARQVKSAARKRTPGQRRASAMKAVHSRTAAERSASARKAARTRARRQTGKE